MRLLIADDHPLVLAGLLSLLETTGHQVVASVRSGDEVLAQLAAARPDALLLDVNMPGVSGLDVLRILRRRGDLLPVVLLTGTLLDQTVTEAVRLQVNGLVLKDTAPDLLVRCLDEVAAGRRWIDRDVLGRVVELMAHHQESPLSKLTDREHEVAKLVASGFRNREIASQINISEGTVKAHLYNIFEKTGITSRSQLVGLVRDELSFAPRP